MVVNIRLTHPTSNQNPPLLDKKAPIFKKSTGHMTTHRV